MSSKLLQLQALFPSVDTLVLSEVLDDCSGRVDAAAELLLCGSPDRATRLKKGRRKKSSGVSGSSSSVDVIDIESSRQVPVLCASSDDDTDLQNDEDAVVVAVHEAELCRHVGEDAALAMPVATAEANDQGIVLEPFECPCCFENVGPMEGLRTSPKMCNHTMCRVCFKRLVSGQIEKKEPCICPMCPTTNRNLVPGWLVCHALGAEAAKEMSAVEQLHLGQADGGMIRLWQCPTPDCTNRHVVDEDWDPKNAQDAERLVNCQGCGKTICVRCEVEEHAGFTCTQFNDWRKANGSAEQSYAEMLRDGVIKPCPQCKAPILKYDGCNCMTCTSCNSPNMMCWQTGLPRYGPGNCGGGHQCH